MAYKFPDAVIILFCKAPIPKQVKTRLSPILSPEQASELHIELSLRTIKLATETMLCPVQLWCAPSIEHDFFKSVTTTYPVTLWQQQGHGLGERMHNAFCRTLKNHASTLLIGCDCPSLSSQDLHEALSALQQGSDVVLAPAEDGGYVLIGMNKSHPEVFANMAWGTPQVLDQTRQQIQTLGLSLYELQQQWDVDTPEDLARYLALVAH
jgi:rSAM/selenodomain-associated transferase 1